MSEKELYCLKDNFHHPHCHLTCISNITCKTQNYFYFLLLIQKYLTSYGSLGFHNCHNIQNDSNQNTISHSSFIIPSNATHQQVNMVDDTEDQHFTLFHIFSHFCPPVKDSIDVCHGQHVASLIPAFLDLSVHSVGHFNHRCQAM